MNENLYKKGDLVLVREDLQEDERYAMSNGERDCATLHMTTFRGRIVTIANVQDYGYRIEEDNGQWNWTDEMFSLENNLITRAKMEKLRGE